MDVYHHFIIILPSLIIASTLLHLVPLVGGRFGLQGDLLVLGMQTMTSQQAANIQQVRNQTWKSLLTCLHDMLLWDVVGVIGIHNWYNICS